MSVPVILNRNGISRILKIGLSESEVKKLQASPSVLKSIIKTIEICRPVTDKRIRAVLGRIEAYTWYPKCQVVWPSFTGGCSDDQKSHL